MTSYIICDVTKALLKYGKYIEKLELTTQAFYMQITMIYIVSMTCVNRMIGASLSEPHTSMTALCTCVCMYVCLFAAIYRKF